MTSPAQRSARAALDAARPAVARLDSSRSSEDLAADLIDVWAAVESALRTLVGTSTLTGQALIREARQRQRLFWVEWQLRSHQFFEPVREYLRPEVGNAAGDVLFDVTRFCELELRVKRQHRQPRLRRIAKCTYGTPGVGEQ